MYISYMDDMEKMLGELSEVFRRYERQHKAKGTVEGVVKAAVNGLYADRIDNLLGKVNNLKESVNER